MPAGHGDGRRLTQVLINLVGNAIGFRTDAGEVVIEGAASDGSFHLSVRDAGPRNLSCRSDQAISRISAGRQCGSPRQKGGTGLGLSDLQRIIEMHGGEILGETTGG